MRSPRDGALRERAKRLFVKRMLLVTASDSEMERALPKTSCAACNQPPIASELPSAGNTTESGGLCASEPSIGLFKESSTWVLSISRGAPAPEFRNEVKIKLTIEGTHGFSVFIGHQMQAMQMGVFFYLPSILLSGLMFPFHAMPPWARAIGDALPLTHFLRCLRASLIRGAEVGTVLGLAWPIALFAVAALLVAIWMAYRRI
jgi:ABC-2 type transporter